MRSPAAVIGLAAALGLAAVSTAGEASSAPVPCRIADSCQQANPTYNGQVAFVRLRYGTDAGTPGGPGMFGRGRGRDPMWSHDTPRAETNFLRIMQELTSVWTTPDYHMILAADDPELFRYPVAYIVEVGFWHPTESEVIALRTWLMKGGFLIVDDFRGDHQANFLVQMKRVLPTSEFKVLDGTAEVFDSFFRIPDPYTLIPPYEQELPPVYLGIFEENDPTHRLMVIANYNQDLAEYWEFSDRGYYPIDISNDAYKFGVNYVIYALTH